MSNDLTNSSRSSGGRVADGQLTTRTGFVFSVRPATPADERILKEFFTHVAQEDLRFRFLSAMDAVSDDLLHLMTNVDHELTENFLAFDQDGTLLATGMIAATDARDRAEVALSIRADYKKRGISWTLLEHIARWAKQQGIQCLESVETREHHEAIELEREMGFTAEPYPGDTTLVLLRADLSRAEDSSG